MTRATPLIFCSLQNQTTMMFRRGCSSSLSVARRALSSMETSCSPRSCFVDHHHLVPRRRLQEGRVVDVSQCEGFDAFQHGEERRMNARVKIRTKLTRKASSYAADRCIWTCKRPRRSIREFFRHQMLPYFVSSYTGTRTAAINAPRMRSGNRERGGEEERGQRDRSDRKRDHFYQRGDGVE